MKKLKLPKAKIFKIQTVHEKKRGSLSVVESKKDIPFVIKRVYYIANVPAGAVRGQHAHKKEQQVFVCLAGSVRIKIDDGRNKDAVTLKPNQAVYLGPMIWDELCDFAPETIVLALAPTAYNKSDYIKNYDDFIHRL